MSAECDIVIQFSVINARIIILEHALNLRKGFQAAAAILLLLLLSVQVEHRSVPPSYVTIRGTVLPSSARTTARLKRFRREQVKYLSH